MTITTAIRADAATSDAEGRAQAAEMVTALTIGALAETVTRLNASEDRALRLEVQRDELMADLRQIARDLGIEPHAAGIETARDAIKALRAEADKLRARPVLTVGMYRARIDSLPGRAEQVVALLGAVTLPAQDRGKDLASAYVDEHTKIAALVKAGDFSWHPSGYKGTWHSEVGAMMQEVAMSRALASLGAPATTPSKPADVFAGVSVEDLAVTLLSTRYPESKWSHADVAMDLRAAIAAVLDALRVKLVAPVDPEAFAREYGHAIGEPPWAALHLDTIQRRVVSMRATLTAHGIPVTPEAGK